jgi:hypothetical protein
MLAVSRKRRIQFDLGAGNAGGVTIKGVLQWEMSRGTSDKQFVASLCTFCPSLARRASNIDITNVNAV